MADRLIKHGGNLREAATQYDIPLEDWVDLSTGINPNGWLPPEIPPNVWLRLPEEDDGLLEAAQHYYRVENILPVAGSQAAIQSLPKCRPASRVGIVSPAYAEYEYCWRQAGHTVKAIHRDDVDKYLYELDVLIVINPNNPDAHLHESSTLIRWQKQLEKQAGWLIVDEAFMDSTPENSLLRYDLNTMPNLIVLRSLGKFFGLAGIRLGFVIANPTLLNEIKLELGSWPISHPARWVGKKALQDQAWQQGTRERLILESKKLKKVLSTLNIKNISSTHLFSYFELEAAKALQIYLAQNGFWVRYFDQPKAIRIGLVKSTKDLSLLENLLERFVT